MLRLTSALAGAVLALTTAAQAAEPVQQHNSNAVWFENWIGFYGIYGFLSCVGLIFLAKGFRKIVKRPEDYYDA